MTITVTVTHKSGSAPVLLKTVSDPYGTKLIPGQSLDITMWLGNNLLITEDLELITSSAIPNQPTTVLESAPTDIPKATE